MAAAATSSTARRDGTERIRAEARRLGFEAAGIAHLQPSEHAAFYRAWIAAGRHGDMSYLARDDAVAARIDPSSRWPALRSAIVVTLRYAPPDDCADAANEDPSRAIIARYARGRDYHKVMNKKLLALLDWLERDVGHALPAARAYVDTGPVLERELARRAGLGWFGRNTMLLHPRRGSYYFLGVLLTELELAHDAPFEREHCGTCNACVTACPTGALLGRDSDGAPVMDATRCISYLTIEQRGPIPRELRPLIGNRVFGCDICQEVCPWNQRSSTVLDARARANDHLRRGASAAVIPSEANTRHGDASVDVVPSEAKAADAGASVAVIPSEAKDLERSDAARRSLPVIPELRPREREAPRLVDLMRMTYEEWDAFSRGRAVRRAGYGGWRRNVAVALGNWGSPEAVPVLTAALSDPEPLIRAHAAWALGRVGSAEARAALSSRAAVESDEAVSDELRAALGP